MVGLSSSQRGSAIFAKNLATTSIDVRPTSSGQLYAINVSPKTKASYYNPVSTPSKISDLYSVEIVGDQTALKFTGPGGAKVGALSQASMDRAKAASAGIRRGCKERWWAGLRGFWFA